jgi:Fe-S-cluster containining protein
MDDIPGFQCISCGKCCTEGASRLQADEDDIALWLNKAPHVMDYVIVHGQQGKRSGDLWISPITGKDTTRCPWIRKFPGRNKYYCRIYDLRPKVCRRYPTSLEHALFTDCPGVE